MPNLQRLSGQSTPGPWKVAEDWDGKLCITNDEEPNRFAHLVVTEWWYGTLKSADAFLISAVPEMSQLLISCGQVVSMFADPGNWRYFSGPTGEEIMWAGPSEIGPRSVARDIRDSLADFDKRVRPE